MLDMVREVRTYTQQTLSQPQNVDPSQRYHRACVWRRHERPAHRGRQSAKGIVGNRRHYECPPAPPSEEPTLEIKVDLTTAQTHGIKPGDVRRAAATLISGILVGNLFEEQKIFDVVVWGTPELRDSISDVSNLMIPKPDGSLLRLGDVADVRIVPCPDGDQSRGHICLS